MRWLMAGALILSSAADAAAQTEAQRDLLVLSTTVYTAALTCAGGLDPDPTTVVAELLSANGIEARDVAEGGRFFPFVRSVVVDLAEAMRGKAPDEACGLLAEKYPRWIRRRTP